MEEQLENILDHLHLNIEEQNLQYQNVEMEGKEEGENEREDLQKMTEIVSEYIKSEESMKVMVRVGVEDFVDLADEMFEAINNTTWRGTVRHDISTSTAIPHCSFVFLTLFWLSHYPTISLLSALFKIHTCTCTQVLQWTT